MVLFFAKIFFKIMNILIPPNIGPGIDSENIVNKVLKLEDNCEDFFMKAKRIHGYFFELNKMLFLYDLR
jgi:hypothetical protein